MLSERMPIPPLHCILPGEKPPARGAAEVGNKAFNLMRMASVGLPVPPGFVLPTAWCGVSRESEPIAAAMTEALVKGMAKVEAATGLGFGSTRRPLLVSVRSGAPYSMPGMMETVLDVGLNEDTLEGVIRMTGNPRLAWDSYRRLIQGYAEVVSGLPANVFDALPREAVEAAGVEDERELDYRASRDLTRRMLACYRDLAHEPFPVDPLTQLTRVVEAVFRSWSAPKARSYRALKQLPDSPGTAVTVQSMVFGNAGGKSGAGVGFTRDPASGEREFYFDFQFNSQGEDVVAGRHVLSDNHLARQILPEIWKRLDTSCHDLEQLFGDAQDFEFTVQSGELFLLQSRDAKRTPWSAVRIAVEMVEEGLCQPNDALRRLADIDLASVARTHFAPKPKSALAIAQVAGIGVASGAIAVDSGAARRMAEAGQRVILVRPDTSTADIEGLAAADGIVTATGGRTSHAAVVARQLGKVCLVSCPNLTVDEVRRTIQIGETELSEGDFLSIDGNDGAVYAGSLPIVTERPEKELAMIDSWRRRSEEPVTSGLAATTPGRETRSAGTASRT